MGARKAARGGGQVLIVDDDPEFRGFLSEVLAGERLLSIEASNGEEALRILSRVRPKLITLDLEMPKLNGWQVLEVLEKSGALSSIPVFVISGCSLAGSGLAGHAVESYFTKPPDLDVLLPLVRRQFRRHATERPQFGTQSHPT
jgi:DNA-binding response OmpR family regulator